MDETTIVMIIGLALLYIEKLVSFLRNWDYKRKHRGVVAFGKYGM